MRLLLFSIQGCLKLGSVDSFGFNFFFGRLSYTLGLPQWLSGKESTYQCRGHRFHPRSREIPHAEEQLSPCATTTELTH